MSEPTRSLVDYLQTNLTDYNSSDRTEGETQWVFDNLPRDRDLVESDYPRIGCTVLSEPSEVSGTQGEDMIATVTMRMDIYTFNKGMGSNNREGQPLADIIGRDIQTTLRSNWRTDATLSTEWHTFKIVGNRPLPYDENRQLFRRQVDIQVLEINPGE